MVDTKIVKVSTIVPAFNAERTIADSVGSVLAQRYDSYEHEVVVVDDGSSDSTANVLTSFGSRIRIIHKENGGAAAARNAGVAQSTGKYLAFLDSDDLWLPDKLAIMVAALERNPAASLAFSDYGTIDENGIEYARTSFGDQPSMAELLREHPFPLTSFQFFIYPSTWVVRRSVVERCGGFSEVFKGAGYEDCWMLLLLRDQGEFVYVPHKLTLYRRPRQAPRFDKYFSGLPTFAKLVKKRYGGKGRALIRSVKNLDCGALLPAIAYRMDRGDRIGAMWCLLSMAKVHPLFFLSSEFIGRALLPQNRKRARQLGAVGARKRSQNLS
jgi:glycosyltransferase involved in cell wall biosynthesis